MWSNDVTRSADILCDAVAVRNLEKLRGGVIQPSSWAKTWNCGAFYLSHDGRYAKHRDRKRCQATNKKRKPFDHGSKSSRNRFQNPDYWLDCDAQLAFRLSDLVLWVTRCAAILGTPGRRVRLEPALPWLNSSETSRKRCLSCRLGSPFALMM